MSKQTLTSAKVITLFRLASPEVLSSRSGPLHYRVKLSSITHLLLIAGAYVDRIFYVWEQTILVQITEKNMLT